VGQLAHYLWDLTVAHAWDRRTNFGILQRRPGLGPRSPLRLQTRPRQIARPAPQPPRSRAETHAPTRPLRAARSAPGAASGSQGIGAIGAHTAPSRPPAAPTAPQRPSKHSHPARTASPWRATSTPTAMSVGPRDSHSRLVIPFCRLRSASPAGIEPAGVGVRHDETHPDLSIENPTSQDREPRIIE